MLSLKPTPSLKNTFAFWFIYFVILIPINASAQIIQSYDVVIYGGTSAGVSAAIQCSRMGKKVILIEPTNRIGGLTTGGLGKTDIGNKQAIGGVSREFYQKIKTYYLKSENWIWETRDAYKGVGYDTFNEDAMWAFEPSVALKVFLEMVKNESNIHIVYNQRLNRKTGIKKEKQVIKSIQMETGQIYQGKIFMDCTYEGDLMAASGVSYTVGRESNSQYGESLNGVQANNFNLTLQKKLSRNGIHHNFIEGVSPYLVKGNPKSGLLPFVSAEKPGVDGQADNKIQAYCYRMTLTNLPENRIPFKKPDGYNELEYELLFRNYEAAKGDIRKMYDYGDPLVPWINSAMPNRKTDINNQKGFSTDFIGQNYLYPEASYAERLKIAALHKKYQQGLMWTLSYHPRIPKEVRAVVSEWGTCKDEFISDSGWTDQLYIREARRMVSDYVMTQKNCEAL
ncbi:MAG TPA: xanthan lyase, partial [Chitinophagaceae bacterium]|nr:xanthan lyase [Chitinophagaceae bacterium]